jgi:hypothetical protein
MSIGSAKHDVLSTCIITNVIAVVILAAGAMSFVSYLTTIS